MSELLKLAEMVETQETWLDYHLDAWESATDKGSPMSAERSLDIAAKHAAIVTALKFSVTQPSLPGAWNVSSETKATRSDEALREDAVQDAVNSVIRGFSFETLKGPENLRARLTLCARQAVHLAIDAALNPPGAENDPL